MKHSVQDKGTLLLALIAGLSINGAFAALFSSIVPFSVFPILSLLLTARKLMRIMLGTMTELYLAQDVEHSLLAFRLSHSEVFQL